MKSFALNISGNPNIVSGFNDLYLDQTGNIAITDTYLNDLIQTVRTSIWMWLGEYEYNTTLGVNYRDIFGNTNLSDSFITYQLTNAILLVNTYIPAAQFPIYGIKQVASITYTPNRTSRILTVTVVIILNSAQSLTITA